MRTRGENNPIWLHPADIGDSPVVIANDNACCTESLNLLGKIPGKRICVVDEESLHAASVRCHGHARKVKDDERVKEAGLRWQFSQPVS